MPAQGLYLKSGFVSQTRSNLVTCVSCPFACSDVLNKALIYKNGTVCIPHTNFLSAFIWFTQANARIFTDMINQLALKLNIVTLI